MLRQGNSLFSLLITVLLGSGAVFSQAKAGEVTITRCWQFPAENVVDIATNGRDVFVIDGGRVVALSSKGEKLWQTDLGGEVGPDLRIDNGVGIVSTRSTSGAVTVNRLSLTTGLPASGATTTTDTAADPKPSGDADRKASSGDLVLLGNDAGLVTSLSGTGPVWKFKTGGAISAVVPYDNKFIVISRDNFVYALRARNGGLEWKRRTQGRIGHYAVGNGYIFVSSLDQHGATLIDLSNGRIAGQIILSGEDQVLTDPIVVDGNFVVATSTGLSEYSLGACSAK